MEHLLTVLGKRRLAAQRGFTAVELLVVISVLAILFALAAPSFDNTIKSFRVRQASEGMKSTLYFARSEAIKRGGNVIVERFAARNGCTAGSTQDWSCGWQVCSPDCTSAANVLQVFDTPAKTTVTRTGNGISVPFNRWGLSNAWFGFSLFPTGGNISDPSTKGVCMSSNGRIRIIPMEDVPCTG